jgi:hypothetical protein
MLIMKNRVLFTIQPMNDSVHRYDYFIGLDLTMFRRIFREYDYPRMKYLSFFLFNLKR